MQRFDELRKALEEAYGAHVVIKTEFGCIQFDQEISNIMFTDDHKIIIEEDADHYVEIDLKSVDNVTEEWDDTFVLSMDGTSEEISLGFF